MGILFVIKEPDVFKTNADSAKAPATYIVFGKAEIEDLSAQATSAAGSNSKHQGLAWTQQVVMMQLSSRLQTAMMMVMRTLAASMTTTLNLWLSRQVSQRRKRSKHLSRTTGCC